jgi:hypothetical protein
VADQPKMIRGALYVLAIEIEDPPNADDETREGIMRVLKGAIKSLSGGGGVHGKDVEIVTPACNIMRFQVTREAPNGSTGS